MDAVGIGVQPRRPTRKVCACPHRTGSDRRRVEEDEVGVGAVADRAAAAQPVVGRGYGRDLVDRLLEAEQTAIAYGVPEQRCRCDSTAHHVEVRSGIGAADDRAHVTPDIGA